MATTTPDTARTTTRGQSRRIANFGLPAPTVGGSFSAVMIDSWESALAIGGWPEGPEQAAILADRPPGKAAFTAL